MTLEEAEMPKWTWNDCSACAVSGPKKPVLLAERKPSPESICCNCETSLPCEPTERLRAKFPQSPVGLPCPPPFICGGVELAFHIGGVEVGTTECTSDCNCCWSDVIWLSSACISTFTVVLPVVICAMAKAGAKSENASNSPKTRWSLFIASYY